MTVERPHRLGILSGVVFVVLVIVAIVVLASDGPELKDSSQRVATFYAQHHSREENAAHLLAVAALFGAIFVAHLWATLRWAGSSSAWTGLVLVGGGVCVAGFMVASGTHQALAQAADKGFAADGLRVLNALDATDYVPFAGGLGLLVLASGAAMLGLALIPRWLAWGAIALGVLSFTPVGFFAFVLCGLWVIVVSVMLSLKLANDATATATA